MMQHVDDDVGKECEFGQGHLTDCRAIGTRASLRSIVAKITVWFRSPAPDRSRDYLSTSEMQYVRASYPMQTSDTCRTAGCWALATTCSA